MRIDGLGLIEFCARFGMVELWADAEPNAQLQLIWLLDYLRPHANVVARLSLVQTDTRIGSLGWRNGAERDPSRSTTIILKSRALRGRAWRAPTPAA